MSNDEIIRICTTISEDMERDASEFDGKPFTGKTVAEYFGYQGAAISALARMVSILAGNEINNKENKE